MRINMVGIIDRVRYGGGGNVRSGGEEEMVGGVWNRWMVKGCGIITAAGKNGIGLRICDGIEVDV